MNINDRVFHQTNTMCEQQDQPSSVRELYWARFKGTSEDQIKEIFGAYGTVEDVVIFRRNARTSASKGCGLVMMSSRSEAVAALEALHDTPFYGPNEARVIVRWVDRDRGGQGSGDAGDGPTTSQVGSSTMTAPPGCDSDAIKLYLGNLPLSTVEADLLPLLEPFGKVVELAIVRAKVDQLLMDNEALRPDDHMGCAFCWYQSKSSAEAAMRSLNLKHLLHDPTGKQPGPLIVRRARMGKPPAKASTGNQASTLQMNQHMLRGQLFAGTDMFGNVAATARPMMPMAQNDLAGWPSPMLLDSTNYELLMSTPQVRAASLDMVFSGDCRGVLDGSAMHAGACFSSSVSNFMTNAPTSSTTSCSAEWAAPLSGLLNTAPVHNQPVKSQPTPHLLKLACTAVLPTNPAGNGVAPGFVGGVPAAAAADVGLGGLHHGMPERRLSSSYSDGMGLPTPGGMQDIYSGNAMMAAQPSQPLAAASRVRAFVKNAGSSLHTGPSHGVNPGVLCRTTSCPSQYNPNMVVNAKVGLGSNNNNNNNNRVDQVEAVPSHARHALGLYSITTSPPRSSTNMIRSLPTISEAGVFSTTTGMAQREQQAQHGPCVAQAQPHLFTSGPNSVDNPLNGFMLNSLYGKDGERGNYGDPSRVRHHMCPDLTDILTILGHQDLASGDQLNSVSNLASEPSTVMYNASGDASTPDVYMLRNASHPALLGTTGHKQQQAAQDPFLLSKGKALVTPVFEDRSGDAPIEVLPDSSTFSRISDISTALLSRQSLSSSEDSRTSSLACMRFSMSEMALLAGVMFDVQEATGSQIVACPETKTTCRLHVVGNAQQVDDAKYLLASLIKPQHGTV